MKPEIMIDLETLDTRSRSVILSVGAVRFVEGDETFRETFYERLELDPQFEHGRTVSQRTLQWWKGQDAAVRDEALAPDDRMFPFTAIHKLGLFIGETRPIWANGPSFDCILWETLCADFHVEPPWLHNEVRDMRTLREESGLPRDWEPLLTLNDVGLLEEHHPVYDCMVQIGIVREARRRIREPFTRSNNLQEIARLRRQGFEGNI